VIDSESRPPRLRDPPRLRVKPAAHGRLPYDCPVQIPRLAPLARDDRAARSRGMTR